MSTAYNPEAIEKRLYAHWEAQGYFQGHGDGQPYCMVIPPPNITGSLHMGHAFQHTIMDCLIRYQRMQGNNTLWQMGTDHAGIATQMLVERKLNAAGHTKQSLGREAFTEKVWEWYHSSTDNISQQLRHMGSSIDWNRSRFTMDKDYQNAVRQAFVQLHKDGLIHRSTKLVNWDPKLQTAISDLEVETEEQDGNIWYIRYPLATKNLDSELQSLTIATTRPETMLGDAAIAVHPEDKRYQHLIGQLAIVPLVNRKVPIIADSHVDPTFGSGCLKITPAHDFNDYAIGKRHNLEMLNIFDTKAAINTNAPEKYRHMDRFVARKAIVQDLTDLGLLDRVASHRNSVPKGDRSGSLIEPRLTDQWFVSVKKLAEKAIAVVADGTITFVPDAYKNLYFSWMNNIQDWCISRQQWWGHRIPAWYDADGNIYVGLSAAEIRAQNGLDDTVTLHQDEDVLETWFSSSLWTFASLGWPDKTPELDKYHPTNVLVTGHDIIFFWVARMIMMSLHLYKQIPFKTVYVHGLIRDASGQKMSKSKGNGLDPLDLMHGINLDDLVKKRTENLMQPKMAERIEKATRKEFPNGIPAFGTDALRFTFCAMAANNRDIRFDLNRTIGYRNFCNKLWNAAHFVIKNIDAKNCALDGAEMQLDIIDKWIIASLDQTITKAHEAIAAYRFDLLAQTLYKFIWHEYCDWYLEFIKPVLWDESSSEARLRGVRYTLMTILESSLRALHPIIPFITEELWHLCPGLKKPNDSIMLQSYPQARSNLEKEGKEDKEAKADQDAIVAVEWLKNIITAVRSIRDEMNIAPKSEIPLLFQGGTDQDRQLAESTQVQLHRLARLKDVQWLAPDSTPPQSSVALIGNLKILVPVAGLINNKAEQERLKKLIDKHQTDRENLLKKLNNANFIAKANPAVVDKTKDRVVAVDNQIATLESQLAMLTSQAGDVEPSQLLPQNADDQIEPILDALAEYLDELGDIDTDDIEQALDALAEDLDELEDIDADDIEQALKALAEELDIEEGGSQHKDALAECLDELEDIDEGFGSQHKDALAYFNRGAMIANNLENFDAAIKDYDMAILLDPDFVDAYIGRGKAKSDLKKFAEALKDYDTAIRLNPDDADAHFNRGSVKVELNQPKKGIKDYQKALSLYRSQGQTDLYNDIKGFLKEKFPN